MVDLKNSRSLTDFQRNARGFLEGLNQTHEPLLLTVNGQVQAVMLDPETYRELEGLREKERFLAALKEGIQDLEAGRVRPAEEVFADLREKYGL